MKWSLVVFLSGGLIFAQSNPVSDAYERGAQLGNQQNAIAAYCLSHPSCIAALQQAAGRKEQAKANKARIKADAQARRDQAKAEKERQKTEITLAKLRLKQEREAAKARATSSPVASATP